MQTETLSLFYFGEASYSSIKKEIVSKLRERGFSEDFINEIVLILNELLTNVEKHSTGKAIVECMIDEEQVNLTVTDYGPGIPDVELALTDHFTTAKSLGLGLGTVRRISNEMSIESPLQNYVGGTRIRVRKWKRGFGSPDSSFPLYPIQHSLGDFTVVEYVRPKKGQDVSGDQCLVIRNEHRLVVSLIDGLGHGTKAHFAATLAKKVIRRNAGSALRTMVDKVHEQLSKTVGVQMALASLNLQSSKLEYIILGNISGVLIRNGEVSSLFSKPGTLGLIKPNFSVERLSLLRGESLVFHSDGISSKWRLNKEILGSDPESLVNLIMSEYRYNYDDSSVMVIKHE